MINTYYMENEIWIPEDLWRLIKSFLIHNINIHGRHLKNDKYTTLYNNTMTTVPTPETLPVGPCIVYCSQYNKQQMVKFVYCIPIFRKGAYKLVIEYTSVAYYEKYIIDNNIDMCTQDYISEIYNLQYL